MTSVARASPSTSSATINSGLPCCTTASSSGTRSLMLRDLLLVHQDVGVFEHALHRVRIGDEVGGQVAAVELHAFDPFDFGLQALAFVDGDDAVLADLFHRVGQQIADLAIVVGGDRRRRWPCPPCP